MIGEELQPVQMSGTTALRRPNVHTAVIARLISGELMGHWSTGSNACEP